MAVLDWILSSDVAYCARLLGESAPELLAVCALLPGRARTASILLGAANSVFLDEARREGVDPKTIAELRERVLLAYAGTPRERPLDRAMARLATEYGLPRIVLDAALEAADWDASGRRYATYHNLLDYCVRAGSAPAVGITLLLGERDRDVLARAADLGVAIALTMIARDVSRHAREGRVLLPIEWLEDAGVDVDAWITDPHPNRGVHAVVTRVLSAAERFYRHADPGIRTIPPAYRPAVRALRYSHKVDALYIGARSQDLHDRSPTTPVLQRVTAVIRGVRAAEARDQRGEPADGVWTLSQPPIPEALFLIDGCARPRP
ncbi:MAG: squalene/phytoene synthase family protein [Polyangiaceae bacterium]